MSTKDYYKILEITPDASQHDIKRSYRRLAHKYHPDKNSGEKLYEVKFREIQEAYNILSDARKRQDYNSRRNRSYAYAKNKAYSPTTPQSILSQTVELRKKIATLDTDRMNRAALFQQIQLILSESNIQLLQQHNDNKLNKLIIEELLFCSRHLAFVNIEQICFQLTALAGTNNPIYQKIYSFSKEMRLKSYWNRYKILAAILVSLLLCIAIYKISSGF